MLDPSPSGPSPAQPSLQDELWTLAHLRRYLGRGRTAVHRLVRTADFPAPLLLGGSGRRPVWPAADVRAWAHDTRRAAPVREDRVGDPHGSADPTPHGSADPAPHGCAASSSPERRS
ncbi:MAG TPA: hypothetical protein VFX33_13250 [Actinomycetales bacterium]|nr:hypothetical protein [Actinomycetales bacterium]